MTDKIWFRISNRSRKKTYSHLLFSCITYDKTVHLYTTPSSFLFHNGKLGKDKNIRSSFLLNDFISYDNLTFEACFLNDIKTLKTTTGADSFTCLAKSTASWIANSIVSPEAENSSGMGTANSIPLSSPEERLASVNRKKLLKIYF